MSSETEVRYAGTQPLESPEKVFQPVASLRLPETIYRGDGIIEDEQELETFDAKWDVKYPAIFKSWRLKLPHLIAMIAMPRAIRKVMYTTNLIESVNSVIRKFTRNRKQYPNRDSTLKMIYMAINEASKRWTNAIHNWKLALNNFAIMFDGRMPKWID